MGPRDFFVRLYTIHMCTEFRLSTIISVVGLAFFNFLGGAIEPFFLAHFRDP